MGLKFVGWNIQLTRKRVECSNGHAADPDQLLERVAIDTALKRHLAVDKVAFDHFCIGQPIESEDDKSKWLQKIPCHKITENLLKFPYFCTFSDKLLHILRMWAMFCLYFGDF